MRGMVDYMRLLNLTGGGADQVMPRDFSAKAPDRRPRHMDGLHGVIRRPHPDINLAIHPRYDAASPDAPGEDAGGGPPDLYRGKESDRNTRWSPSRDRREPTAPQVAWHRRGQKPPRSVFTAVKISPDHPHRVAIAPRSGPGRPRGKAPAAAGPSTVIAGEGLSTRPLTEARRSRKTRIRHIAGPGGPGRHGKPRGTRRRPRAHRRNGRHAQ